MAKVKRIKSNKEFESRPVKMGEGAAMGIVSAAPFPKVTGITIADADIIIFRNLFQNRVRRCKRCSL